MYDLSVNLSGDIPDFILFAKSSVSSVHPRCLAICSAKVYAVLFKLFAIAKSISSLVLLFSMVSKSILKDDRYSSAIIFQFR